MFGHNLPSVIEPPAETLPPAPEGWQRARLPDLYVKARKALLKCLEVDECLEWKRRAEAFASYYRQAQDKTPYNIALRIKLRAWRRCGELFMEMDGRDWKPDGEGNAGMARPSAAIAREMGMTPAHRFQAIRLAKVSEQEFEAAVSQDPPLALTEILKQNPYPNYGQSPEERAAASVVHALIRLWHVSTRFNPDAIAAAIPESEHAPVLIPQLTDWLQKLLAAAKERGNA